MSDSEPLQYLGWWIPETLPCGPSGCPASSRSPLKCAVGLPLSSLSLDFPSLRLCPAPPFCSKAWARQGVCAHWCACWTWMELAQRHGGTLPWTSSETLGTVWNHRPFLQEVFSDPPSQGEVQPPPLDMGSTGHPSSPPSLALVTASRMNPSSRPIFLPYE